MTDKTEKIEFAIIGAGLGGLCAAIRLQQQGITSITVLERSGSGWHLARQRLPWLCVRCAVAFVFAVVLQIGLLARLNITAGRQEVPCKTTRC